MIIVKKKKKHVINQLIISFFFCRQKIRKTKVNGDVHTFFLLMCILHTLIYNILNIIWEICKFSVPWVFYSAFRNRSSIQKDWELNIFSWMNIFLVRGRGLLLYHFKDCSFTTYLISMLNWIFLVVVNVLWNEVLRISARPHQHQELQKAK